MDRVGVIGCGVMGSGIAEVAARAGFAVFVTDVDATTLAAGRERIERSLARAVDAGKLEADAARAAAERIDYVDAAGDLAGCELIVEAVSEVAERKLSVLAAVTAAAAPDAVVATNTSSIPIGRLARACTNRDRFIGLHFFNPVPVMPLVEVVSAITTSDETVARAERFVAALDKKVIRAKDRAGFVVNALLVPFLLAAIRMVEGGHADPGTVDVGMEAGCSHPIGPLRLCDLIGLDTLAAIADALYAEYRDPQFVPPQLLMRMVDAGLLGRKSGRGFYDYASGAR